MDSGLACNSRIQRLLWTQDYITLAEEVVLLESSFVLDRRNDAKMRMVQVGLTSSSLLIAEDKLSSMSPANKLIHRKTKECNSDIELFEMMFLFPLANVRLSVRTHSEEIGNHVIRVRLCSGPTWYLELSDLRHREEKWHEWVWWIHELDHRRRQERKMKRRKQRAASLSKGMGSRLTLQSNNSSIASLQQRTTEYHRNEKNGLPNAINSSNTSSLSPDTSTEKHDLKAPKELSFPSNRSALGPAGRRRSAANRWVHHFAEHIIDHHDEHLEENAEDVDEHHHHQSKHPNESNTTGFNFEAPSSNPLLFMEVASSAKLSNRSSNIWSDSHLDMKHSYHRHSSHLGARGLRSRHHSLPSHVTSMLHRDRENSLSSLEDIQSIGSLVSSNAESWTNRHARDTRRGLLLSVGDLFGKVNFEAHAHGHVGRSRPMASMTRLDVLVQNECNDSEVVNKGELHHTPSLPDVLEGEAGFLEDLSNADKVTHRLSLVYLDLENDDDSRSPHVINGHVMLLTKEQMDLHKKVEDIRTPEPDFRLKHKFANPAKQKGCKGNDVQQMEQASSIISKRAIEKHDYNSSTHVIQHNSPNRMSKPMGKRMSIFFTGANRKLHSLRESHLESHLVALHDVEPDELANELTAIDAELFLRIHEAELVGCMWLKEERNHRSPNVLSAIDFFKKVAGMVVDEVLLPDRSTERAAYVMHFLKVAESLRQNNNFHSLRAILAGLQSPSVYRLQDTWSLLEKEYPHEYKIWQDLLDFTDDSRSLYNDSDLDQAMESQSPCLPFLGSVLMRIVEFYGTVDMEGTRVAHILHDNDLDDSSDVTEFESAIEIVEGHALDDEMVEEDEVADHGTDSKLKQQKSVPKFLQFMKNLAHKVDVRRSRHSCDVIDDGRKSSCMSAERKQHIRMLIIEYAQLVAEEREREHFIQNARNRRRGGGDINRIDSTLLSKLLKEFNGGDDDEDVLDEMRTRRSRHYTELRHMAHGHDAMPWKHRWTSEFHLHEAILRFQLLAVQYEIRERNHNVREFLLNGSHKTDEELFQLSLEREPPI